MYDFQVSARHSEGDIQQLKLGLGAEGHRDKKITQVKVFSTKPGPLYTFQLQSHKTDVVPQQRQLSPISTSKQTFL